MTEKYEIVSYCELCPDYPACPIAKLAKDNDFDQLVRAIKGREDIWLGPDGNIIYCSKFGGQTVFSRGGKIKKIEND
jgi:hypothetical protein